MNKSEINLWSNVPGTCKLLCWRHQPLCSCKASTGLCCNVGVSSWWNLEHYGDKFTFYHLFNRSTACGSEFWMIVFNLESRQKWEQRFLISHLTVHEVNINPVPSPISPTLTFWLYVHCKNWSWGCFLPSWCLQIEITGMQSVVISFMR